MTKSILFGIVEHDDYRLAVPEGARYAEFDHGEQGKSVHFIYPVGEQEFRFTLTKSQENKKPEEIARDLFEINGPLSIPDWRVEPYPLQDSLNQGWACGYCLSEGAGLCIHKAFFKQGMEMVCLTFSAPANSFKKGFDVFENIIPSFSFIENQV